MAEQWYAVYDEETGELVSTGTVVSDDKHLKANGLKKKKIDKQPDEEHVWDSESRGLVEAPSEPEPTPAGDLAEALAQAEEAMARVRALADGNG